MVPIVGGAAEIGRKGGSCVRIGVGTPAHSGIIPITHDLSHGHSHTTHLGMAARLASDGRAEAVIEAALIPFRGQQRSYGIRGISVAELSYGLHRIPLLKGGLIGVDLMLDAILDPFNEMLKVTLHLNGDVVGIKPSFVRVADDRGLTVIG